MYGAYVVIGELNILPKTIDINMVIPKGWSIDHNTPKNERRQRERKSDNDRWIQK